MTDDEDDPPTVRVKKSMPGLTAGQLCLALGLPLPGTPEPKTNDLLDHIFQIGKPKWRNPTPPP